MIASQIEIYCLHTDFESKGVGYILIFHGVRYVLALFHPWNFSVCGLESFSINFLQHDPYMYL